MLKKIFNHPLFAGSVLMVGGNMLANIINYIYQIYFSGRLLGPVGNGQLGSIFALLYIVTIIPLSTSASIVKFISSAENKSHVYFVYKALNNFVLKIAIFLSVLLLILSPFISNFLHIDIKNVLVIPVILFISLVTLVNQSTMQGALKFWGSVGPNIVSSAFKLIFGVIFVLMGWYVFGATIGVLFGAALSYFYSKYLLNNYFKKEKAKGSFDLKKFLKYSFPVLLFSFAFTSFFTMDLILVKHFFSDEIAGHYAALATLGKIIYFAASPIAAVMFPMVSGKHSKGEKYFVLLITSLIITLAISLSAVGFYFLIPKLIISLSYGNNYLDIAPLLPLMGLFICFYTVSYFIVNFFLSIDKVKVVFLPVIFAIFQIILIFNFHQTLSQVVNVSLTLMIVQFIILFVYLVYNRWEYEKRQN